MTADDDRTPARPRRELPVPARLLGFGAALLVTFGVAAGAGALVGPAGSDADTSGGHGAMTGGPADHAGSEAGAAPEHGAAGAEGHGADGAAAPPGGLAAAQDGYVLRPAATTLRAGRRTDFRFVVEGPDGRPVTDGYERESERELHLIVVRRDLTGFQHLHPRRAADGTWSVPLTLRRAGTYRALADFVVGGERRTLGVDLQVAGGFAPEALPAPAATARTDGFDVALRTGGGLHAGQPGTLTFRVTQGGAPVRDLQPYLGARGHLVALRNGDLAYLHVHPEAGGGPGEIRFAATLPSAGRYRLFLQFRTDGTVHTAPLTVEAHR